MRIEAEHTAALVIDYQEKLVPVMHEKENLICQSDILLRGLNVLGIPMFLTQQYTKGLGETVNEIQRLREQKSMWKRFRLVHMKV